MRKLHLSLCLLLTTQSILAQGLVNFFNNSSTLISYNFFDYPGFFAALLTAPAGATDPQAFTSTGIIGTNQVNGRFTGGYAVPVPGWLPG